ncbi:hypothetical protein ACFWN5_00760 [Streptomyces sp. NPDC058430]|uniref:hypothetical protein n=1 Tax=unclassified Streptomyces TaxID=2593676 RepID=UPI003644711F
MGTYNYRLAIAVEVAGIKADAPRPRAPTSARTAVRASAERTRGHHGHLADTTAT